MLISSYLVVELVVEEVLPQRVGQVQDGGDDDAGGGREVKVNTLMQQIGRRSALLNPDGHFMFFFKKLIAKRRDLRKKNPEMEGIKRKKKELSERLAPRTSGDAAKHL